MNQDDCGCGNNNNLSVLNTNNNMNNRPILPNNPLVNNHQHNNSQLNNRPVNNQQVNNQPFNNQPVNNQPVNNQPVNNQPVNNQVNKTEETNMKDIRIVLCILAALSINEAVKYFINKSIRLNNGTSSRYIYYAVICVAAVILYNLVL
jgi:hypothetical protein